MVLLATRSFDVFSCSCVHSTPLNMTQFTFFWGSVLFWCLISWDYVLAQTCLSSPAAVVHGATRSEDSEWDPIPGVKNAYRRTITFQKCTKYWEDVNAIITTRLFDCFFPSQTLRFKRGTLYEVTIQNDLEAESDDNPTDMNVPKDGNTTNIHTHGLHLSGMRDSDNVFSFVLVVPSSLYIRCAFNFNSPQNAHIKQPRFHPERVIHIGTISLVITLEVPFGGILIITEVLIFRLQLELQVIPSVH